MQPGNVAADFGLHRSWKPAWIEDLRAAALSSIFAFNLLDMGCFWTTMSARFREQTAV